MNLIYNFIKSTSHYLINNNITKEGKGKEKRELYYMVSKVVFTLVTFSHIALQNSMTIYIKKVYICMNNKSNKICCLYTDITIVKLVIWQPK